MATTHNQFDFAAKVKDHPLSGPMFKARAGAVPGIRAGAEAMGADRIHKILRTHK